MKILFVAKDAKRHINTFHIPTIACLKKDGWEVDVLTVHDALVPVCDRQVDAKFKGNPIHPATVRGIFQVRQLIDENAYDAVYCHTPVGGVVARLGAALSRKKPKVIYMAHGFHFFKGAPLVNKLLYYPIEKALSRLSDVIITINREDAALASAKFKAKQTVYIRGVGMDIRKFKPAQITEKNEARRQIGIPEDAGLIVSVGEVNRNKNHIAVIQAMGRMADRNIHYTVVGSGPYEEKLRKEAQRQGCEERVHLVGHSNRVPLYLQAADLFVFPSFREGLPVSVMEAMACALPVVASRIRGIVDLIDEGAGGYLYAPTDTAGFAEGIQRILQNPEIAKTMGAYNQRQTETFDAEKIATQIVELLNGICRKQERENEHV